MSDVQQTVITVVSKVLVRVTEMHIHPIVPSTTDAFHGFDTWLEIRVQPRQSVRLSLSRWSV